MIRRFPRLLEDYPNVKITKLQKISSKLALGKVPRGYDKLTHRQKRAARLVVNGMAIKDVCRKLSMDVNTWYRWMHYHPKFKMFYIAYAKKQSENVEDRLDAKLGRAVRVVEDSLESQDQYFAHDAAVKLLSGRGVYKKNVQSQQQISGSVGIRGKVDVTTKVLDKDLLLAFVDAMTGAAQGKRLPDPRVIDAEVVKMLPEPKEENGIPSEVQKGKQKEAVRAHPER